ncbi:hypothetical protein KKF61_01655 [Patescibacteria group bacterium]|nr:hypothetical protein [Patescibacteria group bacterium]MBU0964256.1 hypothetical protein [Patescibacteria group bacterium]
MINTLIKKFKSFFNVQPKLTKAAFISVVFFCIFVGVFLVVGSVSAWDPIGWGMDLVAETFANILLWIASILGKLLVVTIDILIGIAKYNNFANSDVITRGWTIVRDVCNMFFVVILLVIAFGTILKIENYKYNRLLPKMILMAILINFSKMIAAFFIDVTQVVMLTFVNAFAETAAGNFTTVFQLKKMLNFVTEGPGGAGQNPPSYAELIGVPFLAVIMLVIAIMVMLAMVVVFLVRILALWILVVLSPLAYLLAVLPGKAQQYSSQWWSTFGKWATTGPILAFFIWLALAVLISPDVTSYGIDANNPDVQALQGTEVTAGVSEISSAQNILGFILGVAMFMVALSVASSLGGAAGSFAGKMSGSIRGMGSRSLKMAAAPLRGAQKAAQYGVGRGAAYVGRKLRESDKGAFLTPEYWKGFSKRGERLDTEAKELALGKGEYASERMFKGEEAAMDREELARRNVINTKKSDFGKELGKAGESRQAMMDLARRTFATGGHEGDIMRQAFLELATERGNLDDVYFAFGEMYKDEDNTEFRGKVNNQWGKLGLDAGNIDNMFNEYSGETVRDFAASFLGVKQDVVRGGVGAVDKNNKKEQNRIRALAGISEAAKDVGHWEQFMATKDVKTGAYYVMDEPERRDEIVGEAKKRGLRDFLKGVAPHVFLDRKRQKVRDEDGEYVYEKNRDGSFKLDKNGDKIHKMDYIADRDAPKEGSFAHDMYSRLLGGQHIPELRQMQSRVPDQLIGRYFDDLGNMVDTEEDAIKKGFEDTLDPNTGEIKRTALENLKDGFEKLYAANEEIMRGMWSWRYLGKPGQKPDEDRNRKYAWQSGYTPVLTAANKQKTEDRLHSSVNYSDLESSVNNYGVDTSQAGNSRASVQLMNMLQNSDDAGYKGFVAREEITARATQMERDVQWDTEKENPEVKQRIDELNSTLSDKEKELAAATTDIARKSITSEINELKGLINIEESDLKGYWADDVVGGPQFQSDAADIRKVLMEEATEDIRKKVHGQLNSFKKADGSALSAEEKDSLADELIGKQAATAKAGPGVSGKEMFGHASFDNVSNTAEKMDEFVSSPGMPEYFKSLTEDMTKGLDEFIRDFQDTINKMGATLKDTDKAHADEILKNLQKAREQSFVGSQRPGGGTKDQQDSLTYMLRNLTKTLKDQQKKTTSETSFEDMSESIKKAVSGSRKEEE